jgi:diguanylate cyclase (GGDEF)-like protein
VWRVFFFKYTSAVLAVAGSLIGISIYLIHESLSTGDAEIMCIIMGFSCIAIPGVAGFLCGKLIQNLHGCAHKDHLTNLWNSRYFYSQLTKEIKKVKRAQSSLCIALIDLDDFKMINDTYGHVIGDNVLQGISTILAANTREGDTVVRWGGDEFVIIFPDTDLAGASALVERLRKIIEGSRECRQVTVSVGVLLVEEAVEVAQLLKMVDDTLYKAKKTKNLVVANTYS